MELATAAGLLASALLGLASGLVAKLAERREGRRRAAVVLGYESVLEERRARIRRSDADDPEAQVAALGQLLDEAELQSRDLGGVDPAGKTGVGAGSGNALAVGVTTAVIAGLFTVVGPVIIPERPPPPSCVEYIGHLAEIDQMLDSAAAEERFAATVSYEDDTRSNCGDPLEILQTLGGD